MPQLSPNSTTASFTGMVLVHQGNDIWLPYNQASNTGGAMGIAVNPALPGAPQTVIEVGDVPINLVNIGAGNASPVVVVGNKITRGNVGLTQLGNCDTSGRITLFPSFLGTSTNNNTTVTSSVPQFVTALAAFGPSATRQSVTVDGYASSGDGGGGTFVWNSTDTSTANGGTIIAVSGITTGRWNRVFTGPYLPEYFGGLPNGSDASAGIQAAINAAAVGGEVHFPSLGPYLHASSLTITDNSGQRGIRLTGPSKSIDGSFQTILRYTGGSLASGAAASIGVLAANPDTAGINSLMPITGITGAGTQFSAGQSIRLTNCSSAANNFTYTIQAVNSSTSITVVANNYDELLYQTNNVGSDANNGHINWEVIPNQIQCYSRGVSIENIYLDGQNKIAANFDATYIGSGNICTENKLFDCTCANSVYGVKIGDVQPAGPSAGRYPQNCELFTVERVSFTGQTHSCINIPNTTLQSKQHDFNNLSFTGSGVCKYGIWNYSGTFYGRNLNASGLTAGTIQVFSPSGEGIEIHNLGMEDCLRILTWQGSNPNFCTMRGIRYDVAVEATLPNDGTNIAYLLRFAPRTGLDINGANIVTAQNYTRQCQFLVSNGTGVAAASIRNVTIGNSSDDFVKGGGGGLGVYLSIGNAYNGNNVWHAIIDGYRTVTRTDNVSYTDYTRTPWKQQASNLAPFLVGQPKFVWTGIANGNNNNMELPPNTAVVVVSGSAPTAGWTLTGVVAGADGDLLEVYNLTGQSLTLANASASSSAANRFICPKAADITTTVSFRAIYLATVATPGWYVLSYTTSV